MVSLKMRKVEVVALSAAGESILDGKQLFLLCLIIDIINDITAGTDSTILSISSMTSIDRIDDLVHCVLPILSMDCTILIFLHQYCQL